MVNLIRGCRLAVLTGGRVLRREAAAVERREWGKVDRSDSDLSGRVETAFGGIGTAVPMSGAAGAGASGRASAGSATNSSRIVVRLARDTEADFAAAFDLVKDAHERTIFRDIPFSERKARALFDKVIQQPDQHGLLLAMLAEVEKPVGFASLNAGEYFLGEGSLVCSVTGLYYNSSLSGTMLAGKVALRLMQAVRQWAKERRCGHILVHVTNGMSAAQSDQFFRRFGLKVVGGNYVECV